MAGHTSVPLIVALGVAGGALLLQLIALSTTNWFSAGIQHSGLWRECRRGVCYDIDIQTVPGGFGAARAFALIGFFVGIASVVLMIVYMFVKDKKWILISATAVAGATAFCLMVSFAAYVDWLPPRLRSYVSWSFILCIVAFVLFLVQTAILVFVLMSGKGVEESDK